MKVHYVYFRAVFTAHIYQMWQLRGFKPLLLNWSCLFYILETLAVSFASNSTCSSTAFCSLSGVNRSLRPQPAIAVAKPNLQRGETATNTFFILLFIELPPQYSPIVYAVIHTNLVRLFIQRFLQVDVGLCKSLFTSYIARKLKEVAGLDEI